MRILTPMLALLALLLATPAHAQTQYADWHLWHNEVEPTLGVSVTLDSLTGDFRYRYTLANGPGAAQRIESLDLELPVTPSAMRAPEHWDFSFDPSAPVIGWWASGPIDPAWTPRHEMDLPSYLSEIAAGDSLHGFELLSPCANGDPVPYYVRGYNHLAVRPAEDTASWTRVPAGVTTPFGAPCSVPATAAWCGTGAIAARPSTASWASSTSRMARRSPPARSPSSSASPATASGSTAPRCASS